MAADSQLIEASDLVEKVVGVLSVAKAELALAGSGMKLILILVILVLLFGGGGFYYGGPVYGGSGIGLILLICLIIFLMGGFRKK